MCAILFTNNPLISDESFLSALKSMDYRGPDAKGCYKKIKNIKLGSNRLKIFDLSLRSNMPFYSQNKRFCIVYNGEVYNYKELAIKHDLKLRTSSDTEVLVELYANHGSKMLNWLNGMFSFIIVDTETLDFFVARDRLGVKPLYYSQVGKSYFFSSEISPLIELTGNKKIDSIALRQYKKLRGFFNNRTIYSDIKSFPAGHYMLNGKISKYWQLPIKHQPPPSDEELRDLIESSVKYRCLADVPVGSYLSGGLDSTIVAGLAGKLDTWTIGFKNQNEFKWARLASKKFASKHHEVIITRDEFLSLALEMLKVRREPLCVPNEVLIYKMTKEVKKKNTVILSGEGADELFFGYDRIFRWAEKGVWNIEEFSKLYAYGSKEDIEIVEDALTPFMIYDNPIDRVAAFFQVAHLHGLLRRLDFATMFAGVEARTPFTDYRLVEKMSGVSFDYRMNFGKEVKAPLKRIFSKLVPKKIIKRRKVGFPVDLTGISFSKIPGKTPWDRWFEFNLANL